MVLSDSRARPLLRGRRRGTGPLPDPTLPGSSKRAFFAQVKQAACWQGTDNLTKMFIYSLPAGKPEHWRGSGESERASERERRGETRGIVHPLAHCPFGSLVWARLKPDPRGSHVEVPPAAPVRQEQEVGTPLGVSARATLASSH